jgi:thiamine pyrophosphate-dependent acetolactate synthase large subunit-like protein
MSTITAILNAIEARAERAIVPELRLMKKEVLSNCARPSSPDDQEHADALLLKLDRLVSDQVVVATDAGVLAQGFQAVAQAA